VEGDDSSSFSFFSLTTLINMSGRLAKRGADNKVVIRPMATDMNKGIWGDSEDITPTAIPKYIENNMARPKSSRKIINISDSFKF